MRIPLALAAALAASAAAPAWADPGVASPTSGARVAVHICGQDAATRRSFEQRYGSAPVFVTARQVMDARAAGEAWDTPRCMSEREFARLERLREERAAATR